MAGSILQASRQKARVARAFPCWSLDSRFPRTAAHASAELERKSREMLGATLLPYKPGTEAVSTLIALFGDPNLWDPIDRKTFFSVCSSDDVVSPQTLRREVTKLLRTLWRVATDRTVSRQELMYAREICAVLSDKSAAMRRTLHMRD